MSELNAMTVSLEGVHLIEAAAGTGKTYNIQTLVARLLLEKRIPIDKILVVTFTELATGELRSRLHAILRTLAELADGKTTRECGDLERCRALLLEARKSGLEDDEIRQILRRALLDFDAAAISTIHGFCQRILSENAFESGVLFRARLEKDIEPFVAEVVRDEFRKLFYPATTNPITESIRSGLLGELALTPDKVMDLCKQFLSRRTLEPTPENRRKGTLLAECFHAIATLCSKIPPFPNFDAILPILKSEINSTMLANCRAMIEFSQRTNNFSKEFFAAVRKLTPEKLKKALKQPRKQEEKAVNWRSLEDFLTDPFLSWTGELAEKLDDFSESAKSHLVTAATEHFERYREERRFQTFDDLLLNVHRIIRVPGNALAALLQSRFEAGIIDEFQDTDKIQYEIFHTIFSASGHAFFMVGDPRQAIYSFRGGDLATYRRADAERAQVDGGKHTLSVNFRSSYTIINGCNRLYSGLEDPFHDSAIHFDPIGIPSEDAGGPRPGILLDGSEDPNPIKIHYGTLNSAELAKQCANEVLTLLSDGRNTIPDGTECGRPLRCSDIAVLVRSRNNGKTVLAELRKRFIPAVFHDDVNLFDSEDARELAVMLRAVASPRDKDAFLQAALTPLFDITEAELANFQRDDLLLSAKWQLLLPPAEAWRKGSFAEMFETLFRVMNLRARYAKRNDGERKLTNLVQLGDVLQQISAGRKLDPDETIAQLELAITDRGRSLRSGVFEEQLATDHDAVTIMTVHKSKGLEFPIVFLPFPMESAGKNRRTGSFHLEDEVCLELGENELHDAIAKAEEAAENRRLFYVALTRAKYRCTIFLSVTQTLWKQIEKADWEKISSQSYNDVLDELLLQGRAALNGKALLQKLQECDTYGWHGLLLATPAPPALGFYTARETVPAIEEPSWHGTIDRNWRFCSYSSLAAAGSGNENNDDEFAKDFDETPDNNASLAETPSDDPLLQLPGGANLGSAWHAILEKYDFSASAASQEQLIVSRLYRFGILKNREPQGIEYETTCTMLDNVMRAPLTSTAGTSFTLAEIPPVNRRAEMEFHLALRGKFTLQELTAAIPGAIPPKINLELSGGCLNGFLDLLFRHEDRWYVADWKSNRLDGLLSHFDTQNLDQAMRQGNYHLQSFLYSVAVYRFLELCYGPMTSEKFDALWGGVYYLFVRGISPDHPTRGIWFARPEYEQIQSLSALFGEKE